MVAISDADFFARLRGVIARGWVPIPNYPGYRGSGGPGRILEECIGVEPNNRDGPDTGIWELKYHGGSAPITLFHKTPLPRCNMYSVVRAFGWPDRKGRISFRHTIWGRSLRGFRVVNDAHQIIVRNERDHNKDVIPPYWTHDTLINAFAYKLRRLAIVHGEKKNDEVRFTSARLHWEPNITSFINAIEHGIIAIDFDARTTKGPGRALRDHGTKFRIKVDDLWHLYSKNQRFDS